MIVVRAELWSAIDGSKTELARMHIANDGEATLSNHRLGTYVGESFVGRNSRALDKGQVSKRGRVENWRRLDFHIWNLVRRMLESMGYTQGAAKAGEDLPLLPDTHVSIDLSHLSIDQQSDIIQHVQGLTDDGTETNPVPDGGWHCFHCGAHMRTVRGARLHFGATPDGVTRCVEAAPA